MRMKDHHHVYRELEQGAMWCLAASGQFTAWDFVVLQPGQFEARDEDADEDEDADAASKFESAERGRGVRASYYLWGCVLSWRVQYGRRQ